MGIWDRRFFWRPPPGASILQGLGPQALPEGAGDVDTNQTVGPSTSLKASWQPWWRGRGAHKPRASERAFRAWRPGPSRMVSDQSESEFDRSARLARPPHYRKPDVPPGGYRRIDNERKRTLSERFDSPRSPEVDTSLIMDWLVVRILPTPPRIHTRTGFSGDSSVSPQLAGVACERSVSAKEKLN